MATKPLDLSTPINFKVETPAAPTSKYYPINFDATTARFNTEATSENIVLVLAEKAGHLALAVLTALVETLANAALLIANAGIFTVESVKDLFAKELPASDLPEGVFEGPIDNPDLVEFGPKARAYTCAKPTFTDKAKVKLNDAREYLGSTRVVKGADAALNYVLGKVVNVAGFATSHKAGLAAGATTGTVAGLGSSALGLGAVATYSGAPVGALQFAAIAGNPILAPLAAGTALAVGAGLVANRIANRA